MVLSLGIHLRMRNLGDKSCRENHNTHFFLTFLKVVPFMTCGKICWGHAGYGWQYNRPHALCMPINVGNNTDTRSDYVILSAFLGSIGYANAPQCYVYRVIQEESAILWEMIVCVILSKIVHKNMRPILNGYRDMVKRRYGPSCEHEQQLRNK